MLELLTAHRTALGPSSPQCFGRVVWGGILDLAVLAQKPLPYYEADEPEGPCQEPFPHGGANDATIPPFAAWMHGKGRSPYRESKDPRPRRTRLRRRSARRCRIRPSSGSYRCRRRECRASLWRHARNRPLAWATRLLSSVREDLLRPQLCPKPSASSPSGICPCSSELTVPAICQPSRGGSSG